MHQFSIVFIWKVFKFPTFVSSTFTFTFKYIRFAIDTYSSQPYQTHRRYTTMDERPKTTWTWCNYINTTWHLSVCSSRNNYSIYVLYIQIMLLNHSISSPGSQGRWPIVVVCLSVGEGVGVGISVVGVGVSFWHLFNMPLSNVPNYLLIIQD